ncbi:HK97 gp10 family phage protein [Staphylococcus argenteus]|uniref:HK97 gp10 family phage protein n=1 Tax=Staphylococcus argenteus TaxID=985002 RepID=UPI000911B597|nr:HK97 gp10 family phage protein [Staphylococcus argenteus]SGX20311.1 bacteriophage protein [Staphylococcus argenteus]SGX62485.1 bacteriophage protein [Staphylococcus argenteus]SHD34666.1 bacteriophage protein [Staphylococcus argenteus]
MSIKISGDKSLDRELNKRFGSQAMLKLQDRALISGAKVIVKEIKKQLKASKDTGALINEVSFTEPETIKGKRTVTIHWKGSRNRYVIVHLVENGHVQKGTGKFIKPIAMGGVNRAIRQGQNKYFETLKRELKKL